MITILGSYWIKTSELARWRSRLIGTSHTGTIFYQVSSGKWKQIPAGAHVRGPIIR